MGDKEQRYISKEYFEFLVLTHQLYEGYVIGVGYAYCQNYSIMPTHMNGGMSEWGERPASYTHPILATDQYIDTHPNTVLRSLQIKPENIVNALVKNTEQGMVVNIGNGKEFFIPAGANHKINVNITDTGETLKLKVKIENLDTMEMHQTECLLIEFPVVFNAYPEVPSSIESSQGVGQPGLWESMIPFWGSGRAAIDHFQNGNYWRGALYTVLAVSDVFLVKSIVTGLGKGAFKIVGSHTWSATRPWMVKQGYAKAGEPLHHWAISQATAKKYGIEAISNQPWNMMKFSDQAAHMTIGHGVRYMGTPAAGSFTRFMYGTPTWFKAAGTSTVGRGIVIPYDSFYTDYEKSLQQESK